MRYEVVNRRRSKNSLNPSWSESRSARRVQISSNCCPCSAIGIGADRIVEHSGAGQSEHCAQNDQAIGECVGDSEYRKSVGRCARNCVSGS